MSTRSSELFENALRYLPGGVNSPVRAFRAVGGNPFFVNRALGSHVYDVDGRDLVDYVCTWGPSILGHGAPEVIDAVIEAAKQGTSFGIPNPREVELAERICEWVPSVEKVRMCNSGTEATMSSVRLARGFTGRNKVIKFEGCYHGHVDALLVKAGSGALTLGQPDSAGVPEGVAADTLTLPFNDLSLVEKAFERWGEEIAGVILEPFPANAGLIFPKEGFLQGLRECCNRYGAVLIFDEVMTGFRVGAGGVQEHVGVRPDLSAFGKVIGGGLPVGAFGGRREIMDKLAPDGPVYQAGTLSGNPLAMAAGIAQLDTLKLRDGYRKLEVLGAQLEDGVRDLLRRAGKDYRFHRIGSMFCLFFLEGEVFDLEDVKRSDLEAFKKYFHAMLGAGVYMPPSQFETCFLCLEHGDREIEQTLGAMEKALG